MIQDLDYCETLECCSDEELDERVSEVTNSPHEDLYYTQLVLAEYKKRNLGRK